MGFTVRLVTVGALVAIAAFLLSGTAIAQDLSDSPDGATGWLVGLAASNDQQTIDPYSDAVCTLTTDPSYKTFTPLAGGSPVPIRYTQYDPPDTAQHAALILVHGGGWFRGCRQGITQEALVLSGQVTLTDHPLAQTFFVLAVDYRLACVVGSHSTNDQGPLCGWHYKTTDLDTSTKGAAIHDIQDAVAWARNTWGPGQTRWNHKVVVVGSSAGGNLALMAAATAPAAAQRPDVVAAWSGPTELSKVAPADASAPYSCDLANTSDRQDACWLATQTYIGSVNTADAPPCADSPNWYNASPYTAYGTGDSPAFFSNGTTELIAKVEADDFATRLDSLAIPREKCIVDTTQHATSYIYNKSCEGDASTDVLQRTVNFLVANWGP